MIDLSNPGVVFLVSAALLIMVVVNNHANLESDHPINVFCTFITSLYVVILSGGILCALAEMISRCF